MRENLKVLKESFTEMMVMTKKEFLLVTAVCILGGIVFGMVFSPRKNVMICSKNGNNNGNGSCNDSGNGNGKQIEKKRKSEDSNRRRDG